MMPLCLTLALPLVGCGMPCVDVVVRVAHTVVYVCVRAW